MLNWVASNVQQGQKEKKTWQNQTKQQTTCNEHCEKNTDTKKKRKINSGMTKKMLTKKSDK